MKNKKYLRAGFTLVEIMIVVAIIGLLVSVAIPNLLSANKKAQRQTCLLNLDAIDNAKQEWMVENRKSDTDTPTQDDLKSLLKNNKFPSCPSGGTYTINPVNMNASCSIHTTNAPTALD